MQSLRKRGADSGPRASWAFNLGELSDSGSGDEDTILAIKVAPKHSISDLDVSEAEFIDSSTAAELDANLALTASPGRRKGNGNRNGGSIGVLEAMDTAVDAAAMQLMSKAMKFISLEDSPPPCKPSPQQKSGRSPSSASRSPLMPHDSSSSSFFDKGLDAIGSMGKLVEGFAVTLDTVIGQAFEDWGTPKAPGREGKKRMMKPVGVLPSPNQLSSSVGAPRARTSHQWGDFDVEEHSEELELLRGGMVTPGSATRSLGAVSIAPASAGGGGVEKGTTPGAPAASPYTTITAKGQTVKEIQLWRRRAHILQKELQKLRTQRDEYQHVKKEYENLQRELKEKAASSGGSGDGSSSGGNTTAGETVDSLASEQVMGQMQALIAEKARLGQENDRLLRENTGLHELLEFTMQQHAADLGDDELFADENYSSEDPEEEEEESNAVFLAEEESFETAEDGGTPANAL